MGSLVVDLPAGGVDLNCRRRFETRGLSAGIGFVVFGAGNEPEREGEDNGHESAERIHESLLLKHASGASSSKEQAG
jgi:hypothetical protein